MNERRIREILEGYRPGEGLEADPEVAQALEQASRDPGLAGIRNEVEAFDQAFAGKLRSVKVPESLREDILRAASSRTTASRETVEDARKIIHWAHPAAFAAAAAVIILLALSFTFWNRPGQPAPQTQLAGIVETDDFMAAADRLYSNLNPAFRSHDGERILEYLSSRGGAIPANMPGFSWDKSFACDVIELNGSKVSMICFTAPGGSGKLHLFTFKREDFPHLPIPDQPRIRSSGRACCATWSDDEAIHVLYSDEGEENLRAVLDI